jgi:hypothetical protein
VHEDPDDSLRELLLLVQEFHFPFGLGAVNDLRLPIGGPVFEVDLSDQPWREFLELEFLSPVGCSLFEGHVPLQ